MKLKKVDMFEGLQIRFYHYLKYAREVLLQSQNYDIYFVKMNKTTIPNTTIQTGLHVYRKKIPQIPKRPHSGSNIT